MPAIILNQANFSANVQNVLERYYLQPLDGSRKVLLKDGYIERSIHGAMHASRATLWALITHQILKEFSPGYVETSLKRIAQYLETESETVLWLILLITTCHDTGRKGEGSDHWESASSDIARVILESLGLSTHHAMLLANVIIYKDKRDAYLKQLIALGVPAHDLDAFDYARKLVHFGDMLDIVRCVGCFESSHLFQTLATIEGFDEKKHEDTIIALVINIHQFVHEQSDMLFRCKIKNKNDQVILERPSAFSHKIKTTYEHAENVFSIMFSEASCHAYFCPYLENYASTLQLAAKKYQGKAKFSPFIHGTNTAIFSTISKSTFQLLSPLEMMDEYQAAPMTGELTKGGYNLIGLAHTKDATTGKTAFSSMQAIHQNAYGLEKVLSDYVALPVVSEKTSLDDFKHAVDQGMSLAFSNINLILIYLTRARQMHAFHEILSDEALLQLKTKLHATIQFYYFFQLLGAHIHPNFQAIEESAIDLSDVIDAAYSLLTFEWITGKIIQHNIDMQFIVAHPTPENLQKALLVLEIPSQCAIKFGYFFQTKQMEFPLTQFFCLFSAHHQTTYSALSDADRAFMRLSQNTSGYQINDLLQYFLSRTLASDFFKKMTEKAKTHIQALDHRTQLLLKLAQAPQHQFELTTIQKYFLHHAFPIVFVSEAEDKITMYDFSTQEYRSTTRLKLGIEVKIIATDTNEHRLEIMKFLDLHQIHGIQIILFDDLKKSKITKERPSAPYHHQDGFQKLKWLCAKKAYAADLSIFKQTVHEKDLQAASDLLQAAKRYHAIDFTKR